MACLKPKKACECEKSEEKMIEENKMKRKRLLKMEEETKMDIERKGNEALEEDKCKVCGWELGSSTGLEEKVCGSCLKRCGACKKETKYPVEIEGCPHVMCFGCCEKKRKCEICLPLFSEGLK
jgi:hypothetical protein